MSSIFIILLSFTQSMMWVKLDLMDIDFNNSIVVFVSDFILFMLNIINLYKLVCFSRYIDIYVMQTMNWLFYYSLAAFFINVIETLFTLFGAFLNYFQVLSKTYPSIIGLNLTFLLIFSIFLVIVLNTCLCVYLFLMTSKFHSYGNSY